MDEICLKSLVELFLPNPWVWGRGGLSSNPGITLDFIIQFPDKPWYWGQCGLSSNPGITLDFILQFPDEPWDWGLC